MSGVARAAVLGAIRAAVRDVPADEAPAWVGPVAVTTVPPRVTEPALVDLFEARVTAYGATVSRVPSREAVAGATVAILRRHGAGEVAVPADLPSDLAPTARARLVVDAPPLGDERLDRVDGVMTTCAMAVADTGTLVLDCGPGQGRRALTLLPDLHVCVVLAEQVVHTVPEAVARLAGGRAPVTFISGPSATSDIELVRVEGVHGPRRLEVVMVRPMLDTLSHS